MSHIGVVGEKITIEVTLKKVYNWMDYSFSYYGQNRYIYTMEDSNGNILVWKTSSYMSVSGGKDKNGDPIYTPVNKDDKISITGMVKAHSNYKGEDQTVLQRVKINEIINHKPSYEEKKKIIQTEQLESLNDGDFIWEMPYKQYKEHYADCEVLFGSFNDHVEEQKHTRVFIPSTIKVIIREGRLKNSGVRGEHFSGYQMENELGQKCTYRAVSEDNALKRVTKDFPDHTWKCCHIFHYGIY